MNPWAALVEELDRWADRGEGASFWWRDDDAAEAVPALDRLLDLAAAEQVPLALAVVPAAAAEALVARLAGSDCAVLQHGFAHRNHAPPAGRKCELGAERPAALVLDELGRGLARLRWLFGPRLRAVLVPPWNRIAEGLVGALAARGFVGLSTYGPRPRAPAPLRRVNAHVDLVDWRGGRGFIGEETALALVLGHLRGKRSGAFDAEEPTGLLTHHLVHGDDAWGFVARLIATVRGHPAGRWLSVDQAFAAAR